MSDDDRPGPALTLEHFVPYRLAVLADGVSRALGETYRARFGVSIPEWRILAHLGPEQPLSAGTLAERTRMEKPRVTRTLKRMDDKGLIDRATDPRDQRVAVIGLSARGMDLYERIAPLALRWEERLLEGLTTEERATLHRLLDRLDARVGQLSGNERD